MCERAKLCLAGAFRNIQNLQSLKLLMIANSTFAAKFARAFRQDPKYADFKINAHHLEETTGEVLGEFSAQIKAGSFDPQAFRVRLAALIIQRELPFAPESITAGDILRLVLEVKIDGNRDLGTWVGDWSQRKDVKFVFSNLHQEAGGEEVARLIEDTAVAVEAMRAGLGITGRTDPNLCG
ncbi:MAG: hypothetical protein QME05_01180 [Candidatus Margulisbacteria bacterium]|nr:hypothetical protein [Candidatus Margulisiibacteriota bacterium]